jgi:hypothetical protein
VLVLGACVALGIYFSSLDDDDTKAGRKRDEKDSTAETSSKPARPDPKEGAKSSDSARPKDANKLKEGGNTPGRSPTRA